MGRHLAIQDDVAQLDLAVFPACWSRDLSGSTSPLPCLPPRLSAWDPLAAPSLDHCSTSKHPGRPRGAMKHFSMTCTAMEVSLLRGHSAIPLPSEMPHPGFVRVATGTRHHRTLRASAHPEQDQLQGVSDQAAPLYSHQQ